MTEDRFHLLQFAREAPLTATECVVGSTPRDVQATLLRSARRELRRPLAGLLANRSVCLLRPEPPLIYPEEPAQVRDLWISGFGIAIQHVEARNETVKVLSDAIADRLACEVTASLYISRTSSLSLSSHIDMWDVWAVQILGEKDFSVSAEPAPWVASLDAGGWLWMPSGFPHSVSTPNGLSVHISLNMHRSRPRAQSVHGKDAATT